MPQGPIRLHGYWRSAASYRVRIALNLKSLTAEHVTHDLRVGDHHGDSYRALTPQGLVPALEHGGRTLFQSIAILEWLEECYPEPPLLPPDPHDRAIVRGMAAIVAADIHPLNNLRVLNLLKSEFHASQPQLNSWIAHWVGEGLAALEILVGQHGNGFAFGDTPTLADCCLVPQIYGAQRFAVPLDAYPHLRAAAARAGALPAFAAAHPDRQPDADQ